MSTQHLLEEEKFITIRRKRSSGEPLTNSELLEIIKETSRCYPELSDKEQKSVRLVAGVKLLRRDPSESNLCYIIEHIEELCLEACEMLLTMESATIPFAVRQLRPQIKLQFFKAEMLLKKIDELTNEPKE